MTQITSSSEATYYDILRLGRSSNFSKQELKQAYHRALLLHHPDKSKPLDARIQPYTSPDVKHSIDQITIAYKTLSDPALRAEYDQKLRRNFSGSLVFHTGLETIDLDDMDCDGPQMQWHRSCRCGDLRGFQLTEEDLEREADEGEIIIGCKGCSLWLKVLYSSSE